MYLERGHIGAVAVERFVAERMTPGAPADQISRARISAGGISHALRPARELMANRGDEAVHKIAKRARDDEETTQQEPGPAQPPRDSQRGRRSQVNLAVLDQNQAARCLASHPTQGQERRGLVGLGCAKSKIALRVTRRDELYGALAERAGHVEEHDGALLIAAAA